MGLSVDEACALLLLTGEDVGVYEKLNKCIQNQDITELNPFLKFIVLLQSALLKLPTTSGLFFRGVKRNLYQVYNSAYKPEGGVLHFIFKRLIKLYRAMCRSVSWNQWREDTVSHFHG